LQTQASAFVPCPRDKTAIRAWIEAANDKAADSGNSSVSVGTRFEAAYDATFFVALAVLNASGWKHRAIEGHHAFVLEAACEAVGAGIALADRLDSVREVRNQKYAGMGRTPADLTDAKAAFEAFSALAIDWLQTHHAALLSR
jgi:hypothetical protein